MKKKLVVATAVAGLVFAAKGIDNKLRLSEYIIVSPKVEKSVNLVFLSDFHAMKLKDGGKALFKTIDSANPDCVLLGGDIFHRKGKDGDFDYTVDFLNNLAKKYENVCFVTGNHELTMPRKKEVKPILKTLGIKEVSDESCVISTSKGQQILIGGTDFDSWEEGGIRDNPDLLERSRETGLFTVLLRHAPYICDDDKGIDLILSGHNHGGLWRFPKTSFGVAGGGGYLFPRYTHGEYKKHGTRLIVGSGVTTGTYLLPRLYNPPEIVSIYIVPENKIPG